MRVSEAMSAELTRAVPETTIAEAASLMLATTGTSIDTLTPAQLAYRESWRIGS